MSTDQHIQVSTAPLPMTGKRPVRDSRGRASTLLLALTLLTALMLAPNVHAQRGKDGPQVASVLTSGVVKLGGTVQLIIEVADARDARLLEIPKVDGLSIRSQGQPSRSEYTRYINGRMYSRSTLKWSFEVRPDRVGEFMVPRIPMKVDGAEVTTPHELALKVVLDMRGENLGFFELKSVPKSVYEGEPFRIDLRFGWDKSFPTSAASLFLPWWKQMPGTLLLEEAPTQQLNRSLDLTVNRRHKVSVDDLGEIERDGVAYAHLSLSKRFMATRPGRLDLPSSSFEFSKLLQRGGFGRADRYEEYFVLLPGRSIEVLPVPEAGRPFEWTGAVGIVAASRRVDRRDVDAGESIKLTISWSGDANLEFFDAPDPGRMDSFSGFRVLGHEDEYRPGLRRVTYDLVPVSSEVDEIPSVDLWIFDTELKSYRRVQTESVPIRVRSLESGGGLTLEEDGPRRSYDIHDIQSRPAADAALELPVLGGKKLVLVGFGLLVVWFVFRTRVRSEGNPAAPRERAKRRARRRLARELRRCQGAQDEVLALSAFLAARSGESAEAWVGRDVMHWSSLEGGLEAESAEDLQRMQERLDREIYAGSDARIGAQPILELADRVMKGGL